jgi:hypothetical protein
MAIINSKQRKELSKDEFGLPDERRYPLIDKAHVLKAIQFFKYCPDDKKKTLANNINAKAREYGMKINCKGSFAKYISPDVVKHANEAFGFDVAEASNIGKDINDFVAFRQEVNDFNTALSNEALYDTIGNFGIDVGTGEIITEVSNSETDGSNTEEDLEDTE